MACLVCERIEAIRRGENVLFVRELETGYVVLGDFQFWQGYTLFLCKHHVGELHELGAERRGRFLEEMGTVAEAVWQAFGPRKLNYELLGNTEPHLHSHLFPRYADDPLPNQPVWLVEKALRYAEAVRPTAEEIAELKARLEAQLRKLLGA